MNNNVYDVSGVAYIFPIKKGIYLFSFQISLLTLKMTTEPHDWLLHKPKHVGGTIVCIK